MVGGKDQQAEADKASAAESMVQRQLMPLTAPQRGMWFAEHLSDGYSVNTAQYYELRHAPGALDFDLMIELSEEIGKELQSPYARLVEVDGIPMQYVDLDYDQHIDVYDFRDRPDPDAAAQEWMRQEYRRVIDLINDQLIVIAYLYVSDEHMYIYARAHHIILDGYAAITNMLRLVEMYNARIHGKEHKTPSGSLADIVEYEAAYQTSTRRQTDREHWLSRVVDLPERVTLSHRTAAAPLSFDNVVISEELPQRIQVRMKELSSELNSSMAVMFTAAFGAFLARMRGVDDVVLSLPVAARTTAKIKRAGGMISNAVPVRLRNATSSTVREVVAASLLELTGALRHQRYRTEDIQRDAGLDGGVISFGPVINMVFFDNELNLEGADLSYRILTSGILEDLLINIYQATPESPVLVDLHGNPHLYTQAELAEHHRRFIVFLERFLSDFDARVDDIDLFLDDETAPISAPQVSGRGDRNLVDSFADIVALHPDRVAVGDGADSLTYRELDDRSSAIASGLTARGVEHGDLVAIATSRTVDLVSSIVGVLKAGAAYLPLDTSNPAERLKYIIEDASPRVAIVDEKTADLTLWQMLDGTGDGTGPTMQTVDELTASGVDHPAASRAIASDSRAYVIYTSGSTGRPKGVEVTHRDVSTLMETAADDFVFVPDDVWTMFHSYAFDFSVWELWGPLLSGARLVIVDQEIARDPSEFLKLCAAEGVTILSQTPAAFYQFAEARRREPAVHLALRYIVFGGEELNFEYIRHWFDDFATGPDDGAPGPQLVNMYGITETTVHVTFRLLNRDGVRADDASFVGRPLASLGLHILDSRLRPVPDGVVGEIYVTGGQLAQSYLNRPALTASRFTTNPFGPAGSRMYRTGDLARREGDDIAYLGRGDAQVQLRGYRIEYGEIEAAMITASGVTGAAASVVDMPGRGKQLVGYVVLDGVVQLDPAAVRHVVAQAVPGYMVPDFVVALGHLPMTSNGKLDRKALPVPEIDDVHDEHVAPADAREAAVAEVFAEMLGTESVGVTTGFFDLGGNSLSAARLASRVSEVLGAHVSVRDVFESPTVRGLIAATEGNSEALPALVPVWPRPDTIPLSYPQTRMWIINRIESSTAAYNIPGAVRLSSTAETTVDVEAMTLAVTDVIDRHESLRTVFPLVGEEPVQDVRAIDDPLVSAAFEVVDIPAAAVATELARAASTGFDLEHEIGSRFRLLLGRDDSGAVADVVLVAVLHHITGDGGSLGPLIRDVMTAYGARASGAAPSWEQLPVQYADFTLWQRDVLGERTDPASRLSSQLAFWESELSGLPELTALPIDRPRPSQQSGAGARIDTWIDAETVTSLRRLAATRGVTLFTVFQAITATVVGRLSDSDDVAIGTAVLGRDEPQLHDLIGMFVNTVVLRHRLRPEGTFAELLTDAHSVRSRALGSADVSFEQVVDALGVHRSTGHAPLFQVELAMQQDQVTHVLAGTDSISLIDIRTDAVKFDLSLAVTEFGSAGANPGQVSVEFAYATDLFDRETVERIASYFTRIVKDVAVGGPSTPVSALLRSTDGELAAVIAQSRGDDVPVEESTLADEVARQIMATPEVVAFEHGDRSVTYREFGDQVAHLARHLIARGVGPEVSVGVAIDRSIEMYVAIHAVIAAGAQYVPLATDAPADRLAYMLDAANTAMVLVAEDAVPDVLVDGSLDVELVRVRADGGPTGLTMVTDADRLAPLRSHNSAYTLFTSGSTGLPKGVTVDHGAIVNRLKWAQSEHRFTADDVILHKTPITFDVSVWELFWPLMTGARVVIADPGRHGDPEYLADVIASRDVSVVHFVPSMLAAFTDVLGADRLAGLGTLRLMVTSGESLTSATADRVLEALPGMELANLYGPTEAAVDVTFHRVALGEQLVPIGRPVWNTETYVLDANLQRVPTGVPGELYLGGVQVARGYASRSSLTAERFLADPFGEAGSRLYRTGDLVRWNNNGELQYLGRNDFQVKLRGQRLELGEIEAVLASVPGVVHAVATVSTIAGGDHLVGYYAPDTVDTGLLSAAAEAKLPDYMRPTVWMPLAQMPLGSAGKANRKALPAPVLQHREHVDARSETEAVVAEVFAEVLGEDSVTVVESFFDLGGNSLSATKVAARVSARLGREIPVAAVFEAPSVEELAAFADKLPNKWKRPQLVARPHDGVGPLSAVQRGMWLVNRADPESSVANVAMALKVEGELDRAAMRAAVEDLLGRHESLRTRYPFVDGDAQQEVLSVPEAVKLVEYLETTVSGSVEEAIAAVSDRGFDVQAAPPMRMAVLNSGDREHILVVVVHHVSIDGASMLPLARDIMIAYEARARGSAPQWAPLDVQYLDFARWQHEWLAAEFEGQTQRDHQLDYWSERLSSAPAQIELPTDRSRPRRPSFRGGEVRFELAPDVVNRIASVAREHHATPFMVYQAAFTVLLSRLTTQREIVIGTPVAGRGVGALDDVIGMFVNTLALRTQVRDEEKFSEMLLRVRERDLVDMAHADVPFDAVASRVVPVPQTSYNPVYQVLFAFQNFYFPTLTLPNVTVSPVSERLLPAKTDLQLTLIPNDPAIAGEQPMVGQFLFATDLFDEATVAKIAERFISVVAQISENAQVRVADITIRTESEVVAPADEVVELESLADLVQRASAAAPSAEAVAHDGVGVTFESLSAMTMAMAAALPDPDSALTTALMSLLPAVATGGPDSLGNVLGELRENARSLATSGAGGTMEGNDQT